MLLFNMIFTSGHSLCWTLLTERISTP